MKKLMLGLMIAFAVTEVGAGVVPGVIIDGLEYSLDTEAKTAAITGYTDEPTEVRVETVYKDGVIYTVTSVEQFAFYCCSSLTSVYLPKVTLIGNHAFGSCASLVTVFLPAVITIKEVAFRDCPLASVSLPAAIVIAESAFYGCSKLSSAFLPNATSIGVQAFYECTSLTTVVMPYVDKIAEKTFVACPLTSISLPNATLPTYGALVYCAAA